ncbi:MAG: regulatory protein RecX [Actinomycetes bacterium]
MNEPAPGSLADQQDDADPEQVARTILLRRLSASPRTRKELGDDLRKRGVSDEVAERVLDRFVEVGLIDDLEFARQWAVSRQRTKGSARSVLRRELRSKGIDDESVADALGQIDPEVERMRARQLVEVKLRSMSRLDATTQQRRLISMLMRRGYPQSLALAVVREVLGEQPEDVEPLG